MRVGENQEQHSQGKWGRESEAQSAVFYLTAVQRQVPASGAEALVAQRALSGEDGLKDGVLLEHT